jgi:hypothetical protein
MEASSTNGPQRLLIETSSSELVAVAAVTDQRGPCELSGKPLGVQFVGNITDAHPIVRRAVQLEVLLRESEKGGSSALQLHLDRCRNTQQQQQQQQHGHFFSLSLAAILHTHVGA